MSSTLAVTAAAWSPLTSRSASSVNSGVYLPLSCSSLLMPISSPMPELEHHLWGTFLEGNRIDRVRE